MTMNIPSTVNMSNMIEIKLDRLIDEMRFLKSHTIAFDTRLQAPMPHSGAPKGAGLDGDGADQAIIVVASMRVVFGHCQRHLVPNLQATVPDNQINRSAPLRVRRQGLDRHLQRT